ncbi:hypothetical protein CPLU01_14996 [Colletotrichum plurivorum]|uniref:C2H2-type domain-containing protein n=1 Tax=Colletotrichum plurivorum TaxID=2175906 RepID=A0A8H6JF91_9PEZI|nr:hypothetical protein CPLU01_14996 [Colletotrichum plurivorum]
MTAFDDSHLPGTQHHQDYSTGSVRRTGGSSPVNGQYCNGINGNSSTTHQTSASLTAPILASISPALDTAYYPEQILATTNFPSAGINAYVTEAWDSNKMLAAYDQPSLAPEALRQPALTNQGYDTANYVTGYRVDPVHNTRFDQHHETMARILPRQGSLSVGNSPGVSDDPQEDNHDPESGQSADGIFPCSVCKRFKGDVRSLRCVHFPPSSWDRPERFTDVDRDHMRCHDKRHSCPRCPKRFSTPRDLHRHEKAVHKNAFTKCSQCSAVLKGDREDNLLRHMKACHPDVVGEIEIYMY